MESSGSRNPHRNSQRYHGSRLSAATTEMARHPPVQTPHAPNSSDQLQRDPGVSHHQGGPIPYSPRFPLTPEYNSPTTYRHHSIEIGPGGRHERSSTRGRTTSTEPFDLSSYDSWRTHPPSDAAEAYSQPLRLRSPIPPLANYGSVALAPPSHDISNSDTGA